MMKIKSPAHITTQAKVEVAKYQREVLDQRREQSDDGGSHPSGGAFHRRPRSASALRRICASRRATAPAC